MNLKSMEAYRAEKEAKIQGYEIRVEMKDYNTLITIAWCSNDTRFAFPRVSNGM